MVQVAISMLPEPPSTWVVSGIQLVDAANGEWGSELKKQGLFESTLIAIVLAEFVPSSTCWIEFSAVVFSRAEWSRRR